MDDRWNDVEGEREYRVRTGHVLRWEIDDGSITSAALVAYKTARPARWTRYTCMGCSDVLFHDIDEDMPEGWVACSECDTAMCMECSSAMPEKWRECALDECGKVYCRQHARRITTPNRFGRQWYCCAPWMVMGGETGVPETYEGWGVALPAAVFTQWEVQGWRDAQRPLGVPLAAYLVTDSESDADVPEAEVAPTRRLQAGGVIFGGNSGASE